MTEPDCFDLNDWFLLTQPEIYQAVKYLSPSAQYEFFLQQWIRMGLPTIEAVL